MLSVALPRGNPLASMLVEYNPNVNDLADLLADAIRRPMTDSAHRPRQILLRAMPNAASWLSSICPRLNRIE